MKTGFYILTGKVPCEVDARTWGQWMEDHRTNRHVRDERIGDVRISTVFLGLDHNYGDGPPLLFETLVFEGPLDGEMTRCSTWHEAEMDHELMCARVRSALSTEKPQDP